MQGPGTSPRSTTAGVAAATAAVVGFFLATVLPRATAPLTDGDVWWHIRAGEEVLRTGAIPRADTWSIVAFGRPWISQDWVTNVVLALGNDLGPWGQTGLSFLFGGLTVLAFWILWRSIALRVTQIGWASRIVWLSLGLVLAGPVLGVRVQVVDLVFAAAVVWVLWRYLVDPRRRWLIGLPLITVAWANLHAGWVLVFLLGGAVLVKQIGHGRRRPSSTGSVGLACSCPSSSSIRKPKSRSSCCPCARISIRPSTSGSESARASCATRGWRSSAAASSFHNLRHFQDGDGAASATFDAWLDETAGAAGRARRRGSPPGTRPAAARACRPRRTPSAADGRRRRDRQQSGKHDFRDVIGGKTISGFRFG